MASRDADRSQPTCSQHVRLVSAAGMQREQQWTDHRFGRGQQRCVSWLSCDSQRCPRWARCSAGWTNAALRQHSRDGSQATALGQMISTYKAERKRFNKTMGWNDHRLTLPARAVASAELRCSLRLAGKREKRSGKLGGRDGREEIRASEGVYFIQPRHQKVP